MIKQIDSVVCKNKDEWLAERRKTIGSSEVSTLCGFNPYQTALELYLQKKELAPPIVETQEMKMGHVLEPVIDELYQDETGRKTFDPGEYTIMRNQDFPGLHVTLDRDILPCVDHETHGDLQIKTAGQHMTKYWFDGDLFTIPLYVQIQMQAEMAVAEMSWGSAAVLLAGQDFYYADIDRDDAFIGRMLVKVEEFKQRLDNDDPPEPTECDANAIKQLFPEHVPKKIITLSDELVTINGEQIGVDHIDQMIERLDEQIKCRTTLRDEYKNKAKFLIGDAEKAILPNGRAWTCKSSKRAGFVVEPATIRTLRRVKS